MAWLAEHTRHPEDVAFVWRDQAVTYARLAARVAEHDRRLGQLDVEPGTVVAFTGDHSPDSAALFLALAERGAVIVPLGPAGRVAAAEKVEIAGAGLVLEADGGARRLEVGPRHALVERLGGHAGLVVFSSGSTGAIKAALHDLARLLERYRRPRAARRVLAFLLLDHLGGIHTVLHTLASGGTVVAVEDRAPDAICAAIERHRVQLLPTSPTFVHMLLISEAHRRFDLSSLELLTYGTEPMPATTLARLHQALPGVALQQTYGLTELGVFQSRSRAPDSLWVSVGGDGVELRAVDGELWIRSSMAMLGYLNAPSPFDGEGWFNTHDRVLVDGDYLRILGRDSDLINVGGVKVFPTEVESALAEMPNVRDVTAFAHPSPVTGHVVAVRVVLHQPEDPVALRRRLQTFCASRLERHQIPMRVEIEEDTAIGERLKKVRPARG